MEYQKRAGTYEVTLAVSNLKGQVSGTFDIEVIAASPKAQTAEATQVGSMSARLQANVFDLGGMDSNLTFQWGTDANLTSPAETPILNVTERACIRFF